MSTKTGAHRGIYRRFGEVYDQIGADQFSTRMVVYTLELMKRHKIRAHRVLELCCGTGTAAKLFAERGCQVVGVDQSATMLKAARAKCRGLDATFYRTPLPELTLPRSAVREPFDLVTSYGDALNYLLTERELLATFLVAAQQTAQGGWLIFDMNTLAGLSNYWGTCGTKGGVQDSLAWVWRLSFDRKRKRGICRTTFFARRGRIWERFDEEHLERGYTPAEIIRMVRKAGFVVRGAYDCRTVRKYTAQTGRICIVAQKR